jgi:spore germination protein GerM
MRRLIAIIGVVALLTAACGSGANSGGSVTTRPDGTATTTSTTEAPGTTVAPSTTTTTTPAEQRFVQVYFVKDGLYAVPVTRAIPGTNDVAANAIRALIAGPTAAEKDEGLSSAVPADTLLLGITIDNGIATIDLSKEYESGGGSFSMFSRLAQVIYTLTEFPTIDKVSFELDGEPVTVFSGEGLILDHPVGRSDYTSALPLTPPAERWGQSDLPSIAGVAATELSKVVLVASDDVLNVRSGAGVDNAIVGMLDPGLIVRRTGKTAMVGSATWAEIYTPDGRGWVNARYLGAVVDPAAFEADPAVTALLDELSHLMATDGDLTSVTSSRGLHVSYFAPLIRFTPEQLKTAMTDSTTYKWGSPALGPDSPELPSMTFAQAVGEKLVSAYDDPDVSIKYNEIEAGGNGTLPEYAIPFELKGFNYVSVYDKGDDPQYGGLDWIAWYVSIDYERGEPVVVGMTLNIWAP